MKYSIPDPSTLQLMADKALSGSKLLFGKWKKKPPRKLDDAAKNAHDEVFEELDCLKCANCCKSISPVITYKDMERMAGALRMRPSDFMENILDRTKTMTLFLFKLLVLF